MLLFFISNKLLDKKILSHLGVFVCDSLKFSVFLKCRLGKDAPSNMNSGISRCAVCQADQIPSDGLSVNSEPIFTPVSKPLEGPFLCTNCQKKKDAMEGKRSI